MSMSMSNLRDRVENKTEIALKSGDALYFESQNELFNFEGVDVGVVFISNQSSLN